MLPNAQVYETAMGILGIAFAPVWLFLIWLSLRSGGTWGLSRGPSRNRKPLLFWLCMLAYFGLAMGFAWRGFARL